MFHVLPPSADDIFPPDALYAQLLVRPKLGSALASTIETSSQPAGQSASMLVSVGGEEEDVAENILCAGAGAHLPAAHSTEM